MTRACPHCKNGSNYDRDLGRFVTCPDCQGTARLKFCPGCEAWIAAFVGELCEMCEDNQGGEKC